jgi:hypothetical protein
MALVLRVQTFEFCHKQFEQGPGSLEVRQLPFMHSLISHYHQESSTPSVTKVYMYITNKLTHVFKKICTQRCKQEEDTIHMLKLFPQGSQEEVMLYNPSWIKQVMKGLIND